MDKDHLIRLANGLYGLTLLFPKKEPLRYKMREVADDILAECLRLNLKLKLNFGFEQDKKSIGATYGDFEVLDGFFEVAKTQNWVKADDILAIQQGYDKLRYELEKAASENQLSFADDFQKPLERQQTLENRLENSSNPAENSLFEIRYRTMNQEEVRQTNELQTESQPFKSGSMPERQEKIMDFLKENGRVQVWQVKQILSEVTKRTLRRDFEYMLGQGLIERIGERNDTYYQIKIK